MPGLFSRAAIYHPACYYRLVSASLRIAVTIKTRQRIAFLSDGHRPNEHGCSRWRGWRCDNWRDWCWWQCLEPSSTIVPVPVTKAADCYLFWCL